MNDIKLFRCFAPIHLYQKENSLSKAYSYQRHIPCVLGYTYFSLYNCKTNGKIICEYYYVL